MLCMCVSLCGHMPTSAAACGDTGLPVAGLTDGCGN